MDNLFMRMAWSDPGRRELRLRRVDLRDVVRAAMEMQGERGSALHLELPAQETIVMADPPRLAQALASLLRDTAEGALSLSVSIVREEAAAGVLLQRDREGAVQIDERAAQLVQLHGGHIDAAQAARGPGLSLWLPLADDQALTPMPLQDDRVRTQRGAGRHVLLVEDNPDIRESLQDLLSLLGHRVDVAADGGSGLSLALSLMPDAALLDIGLPGMDGYELARRIRAAEAARGGRTIFLVALTGYGRPEDRQEALRAGFSAHLVKPPDPEQLEELLAAI